MIDPALWIGLAATLCSGFFASCNYAFLTFSHHQLMEWLGRHRRRLVPERALEMRDGLLLMTALLRTVSNLVILLAAIEGLSPPGKPGWGDLALALALAGGVIAVFGVAIPVYWSRYAAEPLLRFSLPLLCLLYSLLGWLLKVLHLFDPLVRRILGVPRPTFTDQGPLGQEILQAVQEAQRAGLLGPDQGRMMEAAVSLPATNVDQIMTPRTEIEGLAVGSSLEETKKFLAHTGHSRVPVYEHDLDHILGILYVKDLTGMIGVQATEPFDLRRLVREATFVPESKTLRDLLRQFKSSEVHMAIVLDEYGGTAGLVTIEDLVEELVGEIRDEYEAPQAEPLLKRLGESAYEVSARLYIHELNEELGSVLPEDQDYDTVGGFVLSILGRIPRPGEGFRHNGLQFTVTDAGRTRVNRLRIERTRDGTGEPT